ncbi:hypothetical protein DY000_02050981 [Brassica cretica]|uniref:Uncharacterized protein n=1 Tax=Brassica cretica TaxID=69181 RepID=A0ABQ7F3X3_BRACR|nr:hypothetical protein DY000_02050981 [Brassica cretica]
MTELFKIQGGMLPAVTAITILLATSFPDFFNSLAPYAETISLPLMQCVLLPTIKLNTFQLRNISEKLAIKMFEWEQRKDLL